MGIYIGQNKIGMVGSSSTSQVENGTLGTPIISDSGLITTKVEKSGYLNAGASTSLQLSTQAETIINPSTSEQVAVQAGVYTTGEVKVGAIQTESRTFTSNGIYTPTDGKFISEVNVQVPEAPTSTIELQEKTAIPASQQLTIEPDSGFDGLSRVIIKSVPSETTIIRANGTYTPSDGKWFSSITVEVPAEEFNLQEKTVDPTLQQVVVEPDSEYNGLSKITINAIPTITQATPTISIDGNGEITATSTQSAGWVVAGTTTQTHQLNTQPATTITPSEEEQTIVGANKYTLGEIKVGAISSTYIGSAIPEKQTETYYLSTEDQIISSGQYLAGDQTIKAINLQEKTITENGTVIPDIGYDGLSRVEVNVPVGITPAGAINITTNGTYDITNYAEANVNVPSSGGSSGLPDVIEAGDTPIIVSYGIKSTSSNSITNTGISLTIPKAGTWRIRWYTSHDTTSTKSKSRLYVNNIAVGTEISGNGEHYLDYTFAAGDVVTLYVGGGSYSYYALGGCLTACINWDIGLS